MKEPEREGKLEEPKKSRREREREREDYMHTILLHIPPVKEIMCPIVDNNKY